ncbi:MAG: hypothetical protein ACSW8D_03360 [Prevotella sp.]|jgi:hypothetical protein
MMTQLSKWQSILFAVGALLILVGAVMGMVIRSVAPYVFAVGVLAFVGVQIQQRYEGDNLTIQRLRRIMLFSDVLLVGAAFLMFADYGNPLGLDIITYLNYIHNNWVVVLLLAALIQLYSVFRIDSELKKEAKKR